MSVKFGAGLWIFTGCSDRYAVGYSESKNTVEQLNAAAKVEGLDGVEIIYPWHLEGYTPKEFQAMTEDRGFEIASVNPNIWSPEFQNGAFSNPNQKIRQKAIDLCKKNCDSAREMNCYSSLLWPGQDGFDYPFQTNYSDAWRWSVESYRAIAEYAKDVKFAIEYKPREPRVRCIASDASSAVLICQATGCVNMGVTLDMGHSLQAKENPAAAVELLSWHNRLFNVHINDNTCSWDDDLTTASLHLAETIEFLNELEEVKYQGWVSVDITPYREDAVKACQLNLDIVADLKEMAVKIDRKAIRSAQSGHDALAATREFFRALVPDGQVAKRTKAGR